MRAKASKLGSEHGLALRFRRTPFEATAQQQLANGVTALEDRPGAHERWGGDDQPDRLHEPQPFKVGLNLGRHRPPGHQPVTGQR